MQGDYKDVITKI